MLNGAETECKNFFVQLANFFQMIDELRFLEFGEGTPHGRSSAGFGWLWVGLTHANSRSQKIAGDST